MSPANNVLPNLKSHNIYLFLVLMNSEVYTSTDDMRSRPTFAKLDKESRKWGELCYSFMEDVSRDGDFLNIVDITYIMGTKLLEKVRINEQIVAIYLRD